MNENNTEHKEEIIMGIKNVSLFKEGLLALSSGLKSIAESLDVEVTEIVEVTKEDTKQEVADVEETESEEKEVVIAIGETEGVSATVYERKDLEKMTYKDLQALAKKVDVLATGKKAELVDRLLGEEETEEEPKEEVTSQPQKTEGVGIVKPVKEEEEEIEEDVELSVADKIEIALEEYSEEELADVLVSIDESPKGKRQALLAKIVKAVEDGKLEIDLSDIGTDVVDEEPQEEVEVEEEVEEEITEARKQRMAEVRKEIIKMLKDGDMSEDQVNDILEYVYQKEGFSPKLPIGERYKMIEDMYANLVDDEGESNELEVPYERGGEYACCSFTLRKKANGNLHCEVCDQEYEIG